jgi:hypothetical protein
VGFALASLDSLRLSAEPEMPVPMKLKLRGNANGLNLSTHRSTTALERERSDDTREPMPPDLGEEAALASLDQARTRLQQPQTAEPQTAEPGPRPRPKTAEPGPEDDRQVRRIWANAMTDVAAEFARDLGKRPSADRRAEIIRIGALSEAAFQLTTGGDIPKRSRLLATTSMAALNGVSQGDLKRTPTAIS